MITAVRYICYTLLLLIGFYFNTAAQLKASFLPDKAGGCSPIAISFTNTSSGASAAAVYNWDFGNGNASTLKDAAAVYQAEKIYTITLTVKDSGITATHTQTITVYKKPVVDFVASRQKGCAPLPINFSSNATAGDGIIASYFWGFGDGFTRQVTSDTLTHQYTVPQTPSINLTVTNSYGCFTTLVKQNFLTVLPSLTATFTADKPVLCTIAEAAAFTNTSTGPGTLSYTWNFGDSTTATGTNPSHIFSKAGTYPISLTVNSSEGCVTTSTQSTSINVANFKSEFAPLSPLCTINGNPFANRSKPMPDNSYWQFGNGTIYNNNYTFPGDTIGFTNYSMPGSYTVQLLNDFGGCKDSVTATFVINETPILKGFLVDITEPCGSPVLVKFRDTTALATQWEWAVEYYNDFKSTLQAPEHNFLYDNNYYITLKATTDRGCSAVTGKQVLIQKPFVKIHSDDAQGSGEIHSCGPRPLHFDAITDEVITYYLWDFADGSFSTLATPVHTYDSVGNFRVSLTYTTIKGCKGKVEYSNYVVVRKKVKADFTFDSTNICGNNPVFFTNTSGFGQYYQYYWDFGTGNFQDKQGIPFHKFQEEGVYTIRLMATDNVCFDTMTKTNYIKVSPPFPQITSFTNTCDGTRGEVTFNQNSRQVVTGRWDFGDGTAPVPFSTPPQIKHTYTKTGFYKVVLTTTNGTCTVGDSVYVSVLLKQYPVLTGDKTVVCSMDDWLKLTYSNLEKNPSEYRDFGYGYGGWYHKDGSFAPGSVSGGNLSEIPFSMLVSNFFIGKEDLRSEVTSAHFGCKDTTNFIPLTIKGPKIGFKVLNNRPCTNGNVVYFKDTTQAQNGVALVKWEWFFGDGPWVTYTSNAEFSHEYYYPGDYLVQLKVTDAAGCSSYYLQTVTAESNSLKASFTPSASFISPGTAVRFTNTSLSSDTTNTTYKWVLSDGTAFNSFDADKTFLIPGTYTVKLIAANAAKGCADTASANIVVKFVNAAFAITPTYIGNGKCPPVLVNFTNLSSNIKSINWNFGDGTIVNDVLNPAHVYTRAGFYKIVLTTLSENGTQYITEDSITINSLSAAISATPLHSCTAQSVTLTGMAANAVSFTWDFGDGNIRQTTDSVAQHYYTGAGVYNPVLLVMDTSFCTVAVSLADKIVIDSLSISLDNLPLKICAPKTIAFNPVVVNIAADQTQQTLTYHWDFGTGNPADTANIKAPVFAYSQPGNYPVSIKVSSPYGCVKTVSKTIQALQGLGVQINGPTGICQQNTALFTGSTLLPGQPLWKWLFDDGSTSLLQNPPAKTYNDTGLYRILLIADNGGCADTVSRLLSVHPKPVVQLSLKQATLCQGAAVTITAAGGNTYAWLPATGLSAVNTATIIASPVINTNYTVTVTNLNGCSDKDSVAITLAYPFNMQLPAQASICSGKTVVLTVTGAATYQWIRQTAGLSSTNIGNPIASPATTTIFTVVGSDASKCFTDTGTARVIVNPLPVADAGQAAVVPAGSPYQLQPTTSSDVVQWTWTPSQYLSCANCAAPVTTPASDLVYTLTVSNAAGCTASDTVSISLLCSESRVYIPAAFSPNNDGVNDRFAIRGQGIRIVKQLTIWNRYGMVVFQKNNFQIADVAAAWDGRYKGAQVPAGSYVYHIEMSCNQTTFTRKGAVVVVY